MIARKKGITDFSKKWSQWKPCPLCGNCQFMRKVERDEYGNVILEAHCALDASPEREDTGKVDKKGRELGSWSCEGFAKKKNGKKKSRKVKPWQQR